MTYERLDCHFDASLVQSPQYLDPSLIFLDYKKETENDIKRTLKLLDNNFNSTNNKQGKYAHYWFNYIVNYVQNFKPKHRDFNRFLIYRKKSDEIWKQNFNDYFQ